MATLGGLPGISVGLFVDATGFSAGLRVAANDAQKFSSTAAQGFGGVSKAAGALRAGLAAVGATLSVGALSAMVKGAIDTADALSETAARTGVAVEALQGLQFAAAQSGSSAEQMANALEFFNRQVGRAAQDGGQFGKVLEQQGVAFRDARGEILPTNELLLQFADGVARMGSVQEQTGCGHSGLRTVSRRPRAAIRARCGGHPGVCDRSGIVRISHAAAGRRCERR